MNWIALAKRLLLSDGRISVLETALLREAMMSDGIIDRKELEFLVSLKTEAVSVPPQFDELLFDVLKRIVLSDGMISDNEARWLRKLIFADNQVVLQEARFIEQLRDAATTYGPEFEELYQDCCELRAEQFAN